MKKSIKNNVENQHRDMLVFILSKTNKIIKNKKCYSFE